MCLTHSRFSQVKLKTNPQKLSTAFPKFLFPLATDPELNDDGKRVDAAIIAVEVPQGLCMGPLMLMVRRTISLISTQYFLFSSIGAAMGEQGGGSAAPAAAIADLDWTVAARNPHR